METEDVAESDKTASLEKQLFNFEHDTIFDEEKARRRTIRRRVYKPAIKERDRRNAIITRSCAQLSPRSWE